MAKRFLIPTLLTSAALVAAGWYLQRHPGLLTGFPQPAPVETAAMAPPSITPFLTARTPAERARLVIGGSVKLAALEARYQIEDPDNLRPEDFQLSSDGPADGAWGKVMTLTASPGRGLPEVFAAFRQNGSGQWLLDWDLYHQTLTDSVAHFAAHPAPGETTLRVRLTRSSSDSGFPAIELSEPFAPRTRLPLAAARPDLALLVEKDLPPGTSRPATVTVAWVHPPDGGPLQAVWRRHICWDFEGLNAAPVPQAEPIDPQALADAAAALATHQPPTSLIIQSDPPPKTQALSVSQEP